jgi:hypothetical protein
MACKSTYSRLCKSIYGVSKDLTMAFRFHADGACAYAYAYYAYYADADGEANAN